MFVTDGMMMLQHTNKMEQLWEDVQQYGVEPEHMDRLGIYASKLGVPGAREFQDYFERWGVCTYQFEAMYDKCMNRIRVNVIGLPLDVSEHIEQYM